MKHTNIKTTIVLGFAALTANRHRFTTDVAGNVPTPLPENTQKSAHKNAKRVVAGICIWHRKTPAIHG
ncbi:MAG: hypothetical protein Q4A06_04730 [Cardiobacteriaceae bacterium]|nr:hypothetical protein [Cardiobacteriaceae bacterium]